MRTSRLSSEKNDLSITPILLFLCTCKRIFIDESTMFFGCFPRQKGQYIKVVARLGNNVHRGALAPFKQAVGSLLRFPWPAKPVGKMT
jgi:hypothetical protein